MEKWPKSTYHQMEDKFKSIFKKEFTQEDIHLERENMKELITQ